jgi:hypothetical protein
LKGEDAAAGTAAEVLLLRIRIGEEEKEKLESEVFFDKFCSLSF